MQPAPRPWTWSWQASYGGSGGGHVYILDANGRKIAAVWGKAEEKTATAELIVRSANGPVS
jgi:hypothetical protein